MNKIFAAILFSAFFVPVGAQTPSKAIQATQSFGKIDTADLKMTACDFEKDASAEVLFDRAVVTFSYDDIKLERHKRIKIFNDNGKDEANIRIEFFSSGDETITNLEAETINLDGKSIKYTPVDKKSIYTEIKDKNKKAVIFLFPNVRSGSVVEFQYTWDTPYRPNYPDWFFQSSLPTRYSEFDAGFNHQFLYDDFRKVRQPMVKDTLLKDAQTGDTEHIWAMSNIHSRTVEPYMDYPEDYVQCVLIKPHNYRSSWNDVADRLLIDADFGWQLNRSLKNEDDVIIKANALKTDEEKIAFIFNTVKKLMSWNKQDYWFTIDGAKKAWDKKSGNSTEINLILYHLLKSCKIKTKLLVLSTRDNGKINLSYPSASDLNRTVVYYPVDNARRKHQLYQASF